MKRAFTLDWNCAEQSHFVIVEVEKGVGVNLHAAIVLLSDLDKDRDRCDGRTSIKRDFEEAFAMFVRFVLNVIEKPLEEYRWKFFCERAAFEFSLRASGRRHVRFAFGKGPGAEETGECFSGLGGTAVPFREGMAGRVKVDEGRQADLTLYLAVLLFNEPACGP